jgi:ssDNA-binding Zn-finger/Zn-ribbon topoisomerase 1
MEKYPISRRKPGEAGIFKAFQYYIEQYGDPIPLEVPEKELDIQCYNCGAVGHVKLIDEAGNALVWNLRCGRCGSFDIDDYPHFRPHSKYRMIILE